CNIDLEPSGGCDIALPSGGFVNETFGARANAFRASFKVTPSADRMDGVVGLSLRAAYAFSDLAATVRWNPDGFIDVRGANAYAADVPIPYMSGETYKVDVLVDVIAHVYSVFVDGRMLARNYAFRSQQAS